MTGRRRPKSVRKARAIAQTRDERLHANDPHSFIFSRPGTGMVVKRLGLDLRIMFEPYTASQLKVNRHNVLKDFVAIAGPLHVTHLLYLTHPHGVRRAGKRMRQLEKKRKKMKDGTVGGSRALTESAITEPEQDSSSTPSAPTEGSRDGGVYLHLVRVPHGPSLTFSVMEYSLQRDVTTLIRRVFDRHQYDSPPLLAMTGFGVLNPYASAPKQPQPPPPHLRLIVDMFQNMLPPLNVQKLKLSTVRRVLLISREVDLSTEDNPDGRPPDDVIYIRHYHIRTENRSISRALRRLSVGGVRTKRRTQVRTMPSTDGNQAPMVVREPGLGAGGSGRPTGVPSLAKYTCMEDFLTKTSILSDSGLSDALSDMEEVELPQGVKLPISANIGSSSKSRKRKGVSLHGLRHLGGARTATLRLTEIGPRLTLKLIKIEEGLNTGAVLYHRFQVRSLVETTNQAERLRERDELRAQRRAEHEAHRVANEEAREVHRLACLEGMRRAGQLPSPTEVEEDEIEPYLDSGHDDPPEKLKKQKKIKKKILTGPNKRVRSAQTQKLQK